jgi:DNA polymerase III epsilon subunit-like protein
MPSRKLPSLQSAVPTQATLARLGPTADGFLFFDTETTGLSSYARLVQIAWILCGPSGTEISRGSHIIRPDGFVIPRDATRIHGITTEQAKRDGIPLAHALKSFSEAIDQSASLVAHNFSFDEMIVSAEFLRSDIPNSMYAKKRICTMESSTNFCAMPSRSSYNGYKWPKLIELHHKLFGAFFDHAHDASADVHATAKCFWELKRRGIL